MANGGIIGPVQTVTAAVCQSQVITTKTSSGSLTTQPATTSVDVLVVAGGGGGDGSWKYFVAPCDGEHAHETVRLSLAMPADIS